MLSRAAWSGLAVGRVLLGLLVAAFAPAGPLLFGIDETLERRRGKQIAAKGIYRDAVRSSKGHFVKASGLRWVCLMLLVPIPWAARTWALPFLTALAPSERYDRRAGAAPQDADRLGAPDAAAWSAAGGPSAPSSRSPTAATPRWSSSPPAAPGALRSPWSPACASTPRCTPRPRRADRSQNGRPRLKGQRLPTLAAVAADPRTAWTEITVAHWYGAGTRTVEIVSDTAVWYHSGLPPVPLRWVLIRDPQGQIRHPGAALHRPGRRPGADPGLVRPALADRGHL